MPCYSRRYLLINYAYLQNSHYKCESNDFDAKKSTNMFEKTLKMYHHEINIFLSIFNDWCLFLFRPSDIKIFPSNCCKTNNDLVHWRPWTPLVFDILRPFIHLTGSWYELCKTVSRTPGPFCYDGGSVEFRTPTVSSSTQNNLQKLK